jgi:hypothetical protein
VPSHARLHGDSRETTGDSGQNSLTVHKNAPLLTVRYAPDLCTAGVEHGAVPLARHKRESATVNGGHS